MPGLSARAKRFITLVVTCGVIAILVGIPTFNTDTNVKFVFYLLFTALSSGLKVRLPGITGTLSVNYVFILLGVLELSQGQTTLIASIGTTVQSLIVTKQRPKLVQVVFNATALATCGFASYQIYHSPFLRAINSSMPIMLFWTACSYFLMNTLTTACVIALTEGKSVRVVWMDSFFWTAPQYLFGAAMAALLKTINSTLGWEYSVLVVPGIYMVYRSYQLYLGRLEEEKKHVAEVADLHLRTIEALALAIEAKDDTTHSHLRRVQVYAMEIAREMGLGAEHVRALEAAALLHDIGKLAVPEYIINKPGRLTKEEFEKMKVHPVVGAEILECVQFPYPVVPIVRSHHEKWDGTGYPDGLKGPEIPIGARILAAVDCLDALASDRQYRRALPLEEALAYVVGRAGKEFDPEVVGVLKNRIHEYEAKARSATPKLSSSKLSVRARIARGEAPAAGLAELATAVNSNQHGSAPDFISSIAAARQEFQMLHEVTRDLGNSLSLEDTLSLLASRLKNLIPHDAISIYCLAAHELIPQYVSGEDEKLFKSLRIPLGEGLSGWVAQNKLHIVNGNPSVESSYLNDESKFSTLRSAIAVPLDGMAGVVGVLTLYSRNADAFSQDNLRILLAITSKVGLTIENARTYQQVEQSIGTDKLTGLANAHALFHGLDQRLRRARDDGGNLSVLVLDLDGFKGVNDRFGHLAGNQVLQAAGDRMRKMFREQDLVARMGGDEFVIVMDTAFPELVEQKSRQLAEMISDVGEIVCSERLLSLSVGSATFPQDGDTAEALLGEADKRMYTQKQQHHRERPPLAPARSLVTK
ncbi:MAG: diguanylate cyclase [Bryobacterales bacterium]|nr:diguanylate cyclase [Bryobacterales bacterium]